MPKRQDPDDDEEEESRSGSEEASKKRKPEPKASGSKKGQKAEKVEKPAAEPKKKADAVETGKKLVNSDGKSYVNLSQYRRATINEYKDVKLIDLREVYQDKASGEMKPGKKGISLNLEQWKVLKSSIDLIDEMFNEE